MQVWRMRTIEFGILTERNSREYHSLVLEQIFHQNNCACQNNFYCFEETAMLISRIKALSVGCLPASEYSKRDIKEIAYSVMASNFDTDIASIKQKLNNLRTRFGKELSKERNTKSGQATEELYNSKV